MKTLIAALIAIFFLSHISIVSSSTAAFFPYNTGNDFTIAPCDDCYVGPIPLSTTSSSVISFFGRVFQYVYISTNGVVSFDAPEYYFYSAPFPEYGPPIIAPYWADVKTSQVNTAGDAGTIYYRVEHEKTAAGTALDSQLSTVFGSFTSSFRIVVTWDKVGYYYRGIDKLNTYQTVISSNGEDTYACFFYADNGINWTTGDDNGGTDGLGGIPAIVGFDYGDDVNYYSYPTSRTSNVINIDNVASPFGTGNLCFDIGKEVIVPACTQNSECNDNNACTVDTCQSSICKFTIDTSNCACVDSDNDGVNNCNDGCPNDIFKTSPGICGCGVSDVDKDCDHVAECDDQCFGVDDRVDYNRDSKLDCLYAPSSFNEVDPLWKCDVDRVYLCDKVSTDSICVIFDDVTSLMNSNSYYFGKCYSACRSTLP